MTEQKKTITWGVITAGRITHTFAKDIQHCHNTHIQAVGARRLSNAQDFASKYGIEEAFEGYEPIFNHTDIDAVYVASPHTMHFEHIKQAISAGKHVLCEKPIVICPAELETLQQLANQQGVFLMEAMWTYFLPAIIQAQSWVEKGDIGTLLHVRADFGYPIPYSPTLREYDAQFAGGCLLEMGIYPIAFNRLFHTQGAPRQAGMIQFAPNGVENDVVWQWQYASSSASLHTSFAAKLPNTAYLIGTKGTIEIPDFWRASECKLYELEVPKYVFTDSRKGSGFEFQIDHVCEAIRSGKQQSDILPLSDSLAFQHDIQRLRKL